MHDLPSLLQARFLNSDLREESSAAEGSTVELVDATICIEAGEESVTFIPHHDHLEFTDTQPDFMLFFEDLACLNEVLGNPMQAISAFREHRFKSSGYILWTFATIRMFRSLDAA